MGQIENYIADLQNVQDLYNLNWVLPYGSAYATANTQFKATLQSQADWLAGTLRVHSNDGVFRVQAGPFPSEAAAREAAERDALATEGVALAKRLVARADAVVENFSREVMPKLGLDYPALRAEVARVTVTDTAERLEALEPGRADVCAAGRVAKLDTVVGDAFAVEVELADRRVDVLERLRRMPVKVLRVHACAALRDRPGTVNSERAPASASQRASESLSLPPSRRTSRPPSRPPSRQVLRPRPWPCPSPRRP